MKLFRNISLIGIVVIAVIVLPVLRTEAHEPSYDKKLYWYNSADMYSKMNIYLDSVDSWWYYVIHAHQSFTFGHSTVKDSQLEYFRIYDHDNRLIYNETGPVKTTDYDNSMEPEVHVYKGDNLFRMRVKNKDITTVNGYLETYYWYESVHWENVQ